MRMIRRGSAMVDATNENFHMVIRRGKVLVDFYHPACVPCRALEPGLRKLEEESDGTVIVVRVNVDDLPHIARKYCIQSLPTLILFEGGKPLKQLTDHPTLVVLKRFVR